MAYLCSYLPRDPKNPNVLGEVRVITRGFACTSAELPTELATACRANPKTLNWQYISNEAVAAWVEHYAANDQKLYVNKEGLDL